MKTGMSLFLLSNQINPGCALTLYLCTGMWAKGFSCYAAKLRGWKSQRQLEPECLSPWVPILLKTAGHSLITSVTWRTNLGKLGTLCCSLRKSRVVWALCWPLWPQVPVQHLEQRTPCTEWPLVAMLKSTSMFQILLPVLGFCVCSLRAWGWFLTGSDNFLSTAIFPNRLFLLPSVQFCFYNICVRAAFFLQLTSWQCNCLSSDHTSPCSWS